jgi:hypothetical protein
VVQEQGWSFEHTKLTTAHVYKYRKISQQKKLAIIITKNAGLTWGKVIFPVTAVFIGQMSLKSFYY